MVYIIEGDRIAETTVAALAARMGCEVAQFWLHVDAWSDMTGICVFQSRADVEGALNDATAAGVQQ